MDMTVSSRLIGSKDDMVNVALFVRMEAEPGKEEDAAALLRSAVPLVNDEPETIAWFALQIGPSTFAIFDAFRDEHGRQAHLAGKVAAALMHQAADLFTGQPVIGQADVLAPRRSDPLRHSSAET
jgi:quinol monooxygenase YgiN